MILTIQLISRKFWENRMGFLKITTTLYYNPKLSSGCNLGKDLSKDKGDDQLAKHKDT